MTLYLIKSILILSLLYCSFAVLLSRETFHRFNRLLLVGTLWAALLLPLVRIAPDHPTAGGHLLASSAAQLESNVGFTLVVTPERQVSLTWDRLLLAVWFLGVGLMMVLTIVQAVGLVRFMSGGLRHTDGRGNTVILKPGNFPPFSLLRYIMMSVSDYDRHRACILAHEQEHIRLGHTYDLLLLEVVKALQWFNPLVWMLEQDLKAIHEYEADMAVINQGIDAKTYQQLLVVKVMEDRLQPFSNNLAHGSLKKRIVMMYQKKSNRWKMLKALCLVPVSGLALYVFATPKMAVGLRPVSAVAEMSFQAELKDSVYEVADVLPKYGNNEKDLMNDLMKVTRYPQVAQQMGVQGRVLLSFVVTGKGKLVDIKPKGPAVPGGSILEADKAVEANLTHYRLEAKQQGKTLTPEEEEQYTAAVKALQDEAVRTLKNLPGKWTPGKVKGKSVNVHMNLPVSFRLQ